MKALMNNDFGMDRVLESDGAVDRICMMLPLDILAHPDLSRGALELLTYCAFFEADEDDNRGHSQVLAALRRWSRLRGEDGLFCGLVFALRDATRELGEAPDVSSEQRALQLQLAILSFINELVNKMGSQTGRLELRKPLQRLNLSTNAHMVVDSITSPAAPQRRGSLDPETQKMVHQLLTPDVVSWGAAISACEKGKRWERALGLLQEMVHQLLTPDVMSCNAAGSAYEKGKQWDGYLGLLQEMAQQLLTPEVES